MTAPEGEEFGVAYVVRRLVASLDSFESEVRASLQRIEDAQREQAAKFAAEYVTKETLNDRLAPVAEHRSVVRDWVRDLSTPLIVGLVLWWFKK